MDYIILQTTDDPHQVFYLPASPDGHAFQAKMDLQYLPAPGHWIFSIADAITGQVYVPNIPAICSVEEINDAVLPSAPQALDDRGYIWACQTAGIQLDENGSAIVTAICTTPGAISAAGGIPVFKDGCWGLPELEFETMACFRLTQEVLAWTLQDFFPKAAGLPEPPACLSSGGSAEYR